MAKFSSRLEEFISKEVTVLKKMEEFYNHVNTIKLNRFTTKFNIPTQEFDKSKKKYVKVDHYSDVNVTIELLEKGMLRGMKWIDGKKHGVGHEVLKSGYYISLEVTNDDESTYSCKNYLYEDTDAAEAFDMFNRICAMYK